MEDRRQAILDAAVAIADERGLDAVSMRAVAARVGVSPMALYPHVGSKTELLDGMMGQLLAGLLPAAATGQATDPEGASWKDRLSAFGHTARKLAHEHRWTATLLFTRPAVAPDAVRVVDLIYQLLLDAGVPESQVPRLERLVSTFILGFAASETGGRFGAGPPGPRGRHGAVPQGALPAHSLLTRWLDCPVDWDAEFEADLDDVRRLIEAAASQPSDPISHSSSGLAVDHSTTATTHTAGHRRPLPPLRQW
jgi:AcrR family transcriptional regulator